MEKKVLSSNTIYIKYIEAIRAIACLFVLISHIMVTSPSYGMYASGCGKIGVWAFMLLSGMLLVYPYFIDNSKVFKFSNLPNYYFKKFLKIYPPYLLAVISSVILKLIPFSEIWGLIICTNSWVHFWYIPVIVKFYIIAPIFLFLISNCSKRTFILIVITLGVTLSIIFPFNAYPENSISLIWYLPVFLMGMIVGVIISLNKPESKSYDLLVILPALTIFLITPLSRKIFLGLEPTSYLQNKYLFIGFLWAIIIIFLDRSSKVKKVLSNQIITKISELSYYIYLFHNIILQYLLLFLPEVTFIQRGIITIILSIVISLLLQFLAKIDIFFCIIYN